jgi:uncharacterized membrane protein
MKTSWRTEAPLWALLVSMFALAALTWNGSPDRIPMKWNAAGEVTQHGGRFAGLFGLPLIALAVHGLLRIAPLIDPGRANYPKFVTPYNILRFGILATLATIHGLILLQVRGRQIEMATVMPMVIATLFMLFGGLMGKLRPNWFIGIRTPWTLSSKTAWVRTHRLGGWLMVLLGMAIVIATPMLDGQQPMRLLIGGSVGVAIWGTVYSYLVWRTDPDKVTPGGTSPAE